MILSDRKRFSANEFLAWALDQPGGRYELHDGEVVAMAPERVAHARAKLDAALALRRAIADSGVSCEAMTDGVTVRIDDSTVYEPDALLHCGEKTPGEATEIDDPVLIVEVISPSSRQVDTGAKFARYFRLPSLVHYLLVDTGARLLIHHRRGTEGLILSRIVNEGALTLDPPGIAVPVPAFFESL